MPTPRELIAQKVTQAQLSAFFTDAMGLIAAKSYGARGDGVTNDSTNLQAAIDAAITGGKRCVFLTAGSSYLTTGLSNTSQITFIADSATFVGSTYTVKSLADMLAIIDSSAITETMIANGAVSSTKLAADVQVGSLASLSLYADTSSITSVLNDIELKRTFGVRW